MKHTKMPLKESTKSKISATGDTLPKQNAHVPVRKSQSASIRKPTHSKTVSNDRPATVAAISSSTIPQRANQVAAENADLQGEVNRALEKYRETALSLPQAETVSECIEMQLAALHERLQVSQLLLDSTRNQMEDIKFEEKNKPKSDLDQHKMLDAGGAAAMSSGIGKYQKTVKQVMSVMDRVQKMNCFHDTSRLKQRSSLDK